MSGSEGDYAEIDPQSLMRDALAAQCGSCGRHSSRADFGRECGMTQPDGSRCKGLFAASGTSGHDWMMPHDMRNPDAPGCPPNCPARLKGELTALAGHLHEVHGLPYWPDLTAAPAAALHRAMHEIDDGHESSPGGQDYLVETNRRLAGVIEEQRAERVRSAAKLDRVRALVVSKMVTDEDNGSRVDVYSLRPSEVLAILDDVAPGPDGTPAGAGVMDAVRAALGEEIGDPVPDEVTTVEAVRYLGKLRRNREENWGRCHQRHMEAEAERDRLREALDDIEPGRETGP